MSIYTAAEYLWWVSNEVEQGEVDSSMRWTTVNTDCLSEWLHRSYYFITFAFDPRFGY